MREEETNFIIFMFFFGIFFGLITMIAIQTQSGDTYKQGQIDALNGKIKYKKEIQADSSVIWVEIKEQIK